MTILSIKVKYSVIPLQITVYLKIITPYNEVFNICKIFIHIIFPICTPIHSNTSTSKKQTK